MTTQAAPRISRELLEDRWEGLKTDPASPLEPSDQLSAFEKALFSVIELICRRKTVDDDGWTVGKCTDAIKAIILDDLGGTAR